MKGDRERKAFSVFLIGCAEVYGRQLSEAAIGIYWDELCGFELGAVQEAFRRHFRSPDIGQFFPKPADVIRMLEGTSLDASMVAWAKFDRAVRGVGPYRSVAFDDAMIHRVASDMGGWIFLCGKSESEWPFVANEFRTHYKALKSRGEAFDYPGRLIGIAEGENVAKGRHASAELCYVGEEAAAQAIAARGSDRPAVGFTFATIEAAANAVAHARLSGPR